jgi:lysozyme family protein
MPRLIKQDVLRDLGRLWGAAEVRGERLVEVTSAEQRIVQGMPRYKAVADVIGCPWWAIGIIHGLECSWSFAKHLHNGDPLGAPTTRVPAGRPSGWMSLSSGERTWERSAEDALRRLGWDKVPVWTIPELLYRLETYNGMGYRLYHPDVPTPYLWAGTTVYTSGKYASDGKFDPTLVSRQIGAAALIKRLHARGIAFPEVAQPVEPPNPSSDILTFPRGADKQLLPHFHLREFSCHCGRCPVVLVSMTHTERLQQLRNALKRPITITSGYRCAKHNAAVGGVSDSQHVLGTATDIKIPGLTVAQIVAAAERIGFDGIGTYRTFVHLDSRGSRARWRG